MRRFEPFGRRMNLEIGVRNRFQPTQVLLSDRLLDDILSENDGQFFLPETAKCFRDYEIEVMRTGQPILDQEEPFRRADGNEGWFLTSKSLGVMKRAISLASLA